MRSSTFWLAAVVVVVAAVTAIAVQGAAGADTVRHPSAGLSIRVLKRWHGAPGVGGDVGLRAYTGRSFVGEDCVGVDKTATVEILEGPSGNLRTVSRPAVFTTKNGRRDTWQGTDLECDQIRHVIQFSDQGRTFVAIVVWGRHVPKTLKRQAYEVLNSFSVR